MTHRHAWRAKTPAIGNLFRTKRVLLFSIALPLVALVPGALYFILPDPPRSESDIESIIREAGFDPLPVPSRLRGPGALYQVEGARYIKVCDVDPTLLAGRVDKSPTEERTRQRLEAGSFSVKGSYLKAFTADIGGDRGIAIEYRLRNVAVSEISMSKLLEIQDVLLSQENCQRTVQGLLMRNKQVCPGYSAISATTSYKLRNHAKFGFGTETEAPAVHAVKKAIEAQAGSQIRVESTDELSGDDLFYGIQLSELCITPQGATEPSVRPPKPAPEQSGFLPWLFGSRKTI